MITFLLEDNLIHSGIRDDRDVSAVVFVGHEIGACRPETLVNRPRHMAASMWDVTGAEHVMVQGHALRLKGFHEELGYRGQVVGLCVQWAGVAMALGIGLEPGLWVEGFRL